ncbi:MAG: lipopolysaccharide kinase InaA family protein [Gemmatimonadaceae bacterium]
MMSEMIPIVGYEHVTVGGANVLVARALAATTRDILEHETLYSYAAKDPDALIFQGRAPVYAIKLAPLSGRVAVRHVMRGGVVGRLLHDRFLPPTRVARELTAAFRLRLGGVPTPEVLAVGTYPAGGFFRRADVMTRFVEGGADLSAVFGDVRNDEQRRPILDAVAQLLSRLTATGAQHPDLNLKNVLITSADHGYVAHVLDVDRVHFHVPGDPLVARANIERLMRSLRQWRTRLAPRANTLSDDDMAYLALAAAAQPA